MNVHTHKTVTILRDVDWDEYQVPSEQEGSYYYTDDKEDAVDTAKAIHGQDAIIKYRQVVPTYN